MAVVAKKEERKKERKKERKEDRKTDRHKKVTLYKYTTIKHQLAKCYLIVYS